MAKDRPVRRNWFKGFTPEILNNIGGGSNLPPDVHDRGFSVPVSRRQPRGGQHRNQVASLDDRTTDIYERDSEK